MNLSLDFGAPVPAPSGPTRHPLIRPDASLERVADALEELSRREGSPITAIRRQPARDAQYAQMPAALDPRLREVLAQRGITQLYTHQADAYEHVRQGENIVVVTPTASGKTLCYNLPVLEALTRDPGACALYLFPTKALSEDQLEEFHGIVEAMGADVRAFTYDGDTPGDARRKVRQRANVVLTNPEMLHAGVLPHHTRWARFFENLRYIVVDELHTYRGVFGSHLANVFRRLARICRFYGSNPQFICCSATIANPKELAEQLVEHPVTEISNNGAPSGEKFFAFYNPPVVNLQLGIRRSYIAESRRMAEELLHKGRQTLVFCNNRLATEILLRYLKDSCEKGRAPKGAIRGYRGGYLAKERRAIERQMREGEILGIVATNALELGIDIGSLDAVVLAGYPGSIASTWQRAGRAGRRKSMSVAVMVASSAPLDQYMVDNPDAFFDAPPERGCVNPDNLEILLNHVKCAAFELPIQDGELYGPHQTAEMCKFLEETGVVHHAGDAWHWTSESYPANAVSLRSVSSDNFVVIDTTHEANVIADVAFDAALRTLHEKAIYMHQSRLYHVDKFDYEERKAYVHSVDCDYYTDAIDHTQVKILEEFDNAASGLTAVAHGDIRLNTQIVGFKKIKFYTNENVGAGNLTMPEQEMHTTAFWYAFNRDYMESLSGFSLTEKQSGITGLGNVLRTVGSLLLMCDPRDLGVATTGKDEHGSLGYEPNLYLYDNYPGGVGQSEPLFAMREQLQARATHLLASCPCDEGCPSCVGALGQVGERAKEVAARYLADMASSHIAGASTS